MNPSASFGCILYLANAALFVAGDNVAASEPDDFVLILFEQLEDYHAHCSNCKSSNRRRPG